MNICGAQAGGGGQKAYALPALAVQVDLEILPVRAGRDVYDTKDPSSRAVGVEGGEAIGGEFEKIIVEHRAGVVGIDRHRNDVCLHKVVKKWAPKEGSGVAPISRRAISASTFVRIHILHNRRDTNDRFNMDWRFGDAVEIYSGGSSPCKV